MGMIGGGKDAFIGAIHRIAANMDGLIELSCGALSINPEVAKESAKMLFIPEDRTYLTYDEMIKKESELPADKRIDFVGGIRGLAELEKRVNSGEMKVAFSLYPVSLSQLFDIADSGNVMPPKSTWFEPKLRDGLLTHLIYE